MGVVRSLLSLGFVTLLVAGATSSITASVAFAGTSSEEEGTPGPDGGTKDDGDEATPVPEN